jgi:hypothetical protein
VLFLHHQRAHLVVMETATVGLGIHVESGSPPLLCFHAHFGVWLRFLRNNVARVQVVDQIHSYLKEVADDMQNDRIRLEEYTITKGLTKAPEEYSDAKSQPHVQVSFESSRASETSWLQSSMNLFQACPCPHALDSEHMAMAQTQHARFELTAGSMPLDRRQSA